MPCYVWRIRNSKWEVSMKRVSLGFVLVVLLVTVGCGGYGSNYMGGGAGAPSITQLMPGSTPANGPAFTLTVDGTAFGSDAVVYWGTTPQSSAYVAASRVTAQIPAADIANAGTVSVYVRSGGKNSNSMNFTVQ